MKFRNSFSDEPSPFDGSRALSTAERRASWNRRCEALTAFHFSQGDYTDLPALSIQKRAQSDPVIAAEVSKGEWD